MATVITMGRDTPERTLDLLRAFIAMARKFCEGTAAWISVESFCAQLEYGLADDEAGILTPYRLNTLWILSLQCARQTGVFPFSFFCDGIETWLVVFSDKMQITFMAGPVGMLSAYACEDGPAAERLLCPLIEEASRHVSGWILSTCAAQPRLRFPIDWSMATPLGDEPLDLHDIVRILLTPA
jgi:hypothetical protein